MTSDARQVWRFLRSNLWLAVATAVAVAGLVIALLAIAGLGQVQDQREADRIASDVAGCQRGNVNRANQSETLRNVVHDVSVYLGADELRASQIVGAIEDTTEPTVTDCSQVILGADPDTADFPP